MSCHVARFVRLLSCIKGTCPCSGSQGISAHTEDLLRNMDCITEAQSKGLVVFCWGDDNNNHENRRILREKGIDGLIYDRFYDISLSLYNHDHLRNCSLLRSLSRFPCAFLPATL